MKRPTRIILGYLWAVFWILFLFPLLAILFSSFLDKKIGLRPFIPSPFHYYLSIPFFALGAFWITWSLTYLIRIGRGHPLSEPGMEIQPKTTTLVTTGPYRYTRNPMVLGYWLLLFAVSIILNSTSFLFILFPCLLIYSYLYTMLVEEPWTAKRFGSDYADYKKRTPRFIPRFKIKG